MLTRICIKGFKNLVDAEIRFGAFTCVAGLNGAGKSNLFDVIAFLRDLADFPIAEAASRIRSIEGNNNSSIASLFSKKPGGGWRELHIEVDFFVPKIVFDDFERQATPSTTFLTYKVVLKYIPADAGVEKIELLLEELTYIPKSETKKRIGFPASKGFLDSVLGGNKRSDFISTLNETQDSKTVILLHQDQAKGSPSRVPASTTPRTVLSTVNTDDRPTALAARREMQSWAQLQLEPSKLRMPDSFSSDEKLTAAGEHLPATLLRLNRFDQISNTLSQLLPHIDGLRVDIDETRRSKTLYLKQRNGEEHPARSLSDGTLRFLALATLSHDPVAGGLICIEEPENGIHPARIPAIVDLLKSMVVDIGAEVSDENPLRQIIINTHSPSVVQRLNTEDLVLATPVRLGATTVTAFAAIKNTWRENIPTISLRAKPLSRDGLIDYLQNVKSEALFEAPNEITIANWAQKELGLT